MGWDRVYAEEGDSTRSNCEYALKDLRTHKNH